MRSPGVMIRSPFSSGSVGRAHRQEIAGRFCAPRGAQASDCLGEGELLAGEAGDEASATHLSPSLEAAVDQQQVPPGRQVGFPLE